jgi:hypothetical protein
LQLILCFDGNFKMGAEGDKLLETYLPVRNRVCVYHGSPNSLRGNANINSLTHSTATLKHSAIQNPLRTRNVVKEAMTGNMSDERIIVYSQWARELGFVQSRRNKYVLVSHRDSGHNVPAGRTPSHPEMDTGEVGFAQMMLRVRMKGFIPVPMGAPSGIPQMHPSLIKWWETTPDALKGMRLTKDQIENGMIRYLAENFGVRLLAMRSGQTDAMAFSGMETIFIDMAAEGLNSHEVHQAGLTDSDQSNRSWRRAAMLESILPGIFHQVFVLHPRKDDIQPGPGVQWNGKFDSEDIANLDHSLEYYFGHLGQESYNKALRHKSSPVHYARTGEFHRRVEARNPVESRSVKYESIRAFVDEIHGERHQQTDTPSSELNELFLILENIETRLLVLSKDIERLRTQLQQLATLAHQLERI